MPGIVQIDKSRTRTMWRLCAAHKLCPWLLNTSRKRTVVVMSLMT